MSVEFNELIPYQQMILIIRSIKTGGFSLAAVEENTV